MNLKACQAAAAPSYESGGFCPASKTWRLAEAPTVEDKYTKDAVR
jgi:hypothetical protein